MISVNVLGEGINIPEIRNCILYEKRTSKINLMQIMGRTLRKTENKAPFSRLIVLASPEEAKNYMEIIIRALNDNVKDINEFYKNNLEFDNQTLTEFDFEKLFFDTLLKTYRRVPDEKFIEMCKDYVKNNGKIIETDNKIDPEKEAYDIPKISEIYEFENKIYMLGSKLYYLRYDTKKDNLKETIEQIFNQHIIPANEKINNPKDFNYQLKVFKEYFRKMMKDQCVELCLKMLMLEELEKKF